MRQQQILWHTSRLKTVDIKVKGQRKLPEQTECNFWLLKTAMKRQINREHEYSVCFARNCANYSLASTAERSLQVIPFTEGVGRQQRQGDSGFSSQDRLWHIKNKILDAETITVFTVQLILMGRAWRQCSGALHVTSALQPYADVDNSFLPQFRLQFLHNCGANCIRSAAFSHPVFFVSAVFHTQLI